MAFSALGNKIQRGGEREREKAIASSSAANSQKAISDNLLARRGYSGALAIPPAGIQFPTGGRLRGRHN